MADYPNREHEFDPKEPDGLSCNGCGRGRHHQNHSRDGQAYPNREHEKAHKAAERRALSALDAIEEEARILAIRVRQCRDLDADATRAMAGKVHDLTGYLAELDILRQVCEWDAADRAEAQAG